MIQQFTIHKLKMLEHMFKEGLYGKKWAGGLYYSNSRQLQELGLIREKYDGSDWDYSREYQLTAKGRKLAEVVAKELDEAEAAYLADIESRLSKVIKKLEAPQ